LFIPTLASAYHTVSVSFPRVHIGIKALDLHGFGLEIHIEEKRNIKILLLKVQVRFNTFKGE